MNWNEDSDDMVILDGVKSILVGLDIDGAGMAYLLEETQLEGQMLRQLVKGAKQYDLDHAIDERKEANSVEFTPKPENKLSKEATTRVYEQADFLGQEGDYCLMREIDKANRELYYIVEEDILYDRHKAWEVEFSEVEHIFTIN